MHDDKQAPATKEDVRGIMEYLARNEEKIVEVKRDAEEFKEEVKRHFEDVKRHFDVVAENLLYDFKGALNDKIQNHENRIVRIEEHIGLAV